MLKKLYFVLIIGCSLFCNAQDKQSTDPINDYLETIIKPNEQIFILEEKVSLSEVFRIFPGKHSFTSTNEEERFMGVSDSLYNEKCFVKMKQKYFNEQPTIPKTTYLVNDKWKKDDFKYPNMELVSYKKMTEKMADPKVDSVIQDLRIKNVFLISDVVFYKRKKYALFALTKCKYELWDYNYSIMKVIVMQKINKKWRLVEVVNDYIFK